MKAGTLAIECSTVSYQHALDLARELRGRGLIYIDSPVTGLAGCRGERKTDAAGRRRCRPISNARGRFSRRSSTTIRHFGAVGSGTVYKLINNLMGAIQIAGIAEGLAIAEQAGLDMKLVLEAIETGVAASPQVIRHSKRMAARNFSGATFTAALRHKDAAYAVALAESLLSDVPMMGRAAVEAYERAKAHAPDDDEGKMIEIVSRAKAARPNQRLSALPSIPHSQPVNRPLSRSPPCHAAVHRAVVGHQQHHVEPLGAAQRVDRLAAASARSDRRH